MGKDVITVGLQTSSEDGGTSKHVLALRTLLRSHCAGPYSNEVDEFALVLRVGGDMREFDFEGCERIRRSHKERYITVDIGFPSKNWRGASDSEIRRRIAESVETGLLCCIRRLEKDRSSISSHKLMDDFNAAKKGYLQE